MHKVYNKACQLLSSHDTIEEAIDEACRLRKEKHEVYVSYKLKDGEKTREQRQSERATKHMHGSSEIHESGRDDSGDEMHDVRESNTSE